ncbi:MAG: YegS/Rv2252/BmrU family lipid kinase [Oscillospiraceae bacterium]
MKKLMFIINPVAGRGSYKQGLGEALGVLYAGGYVPTLYFTTRAGEAVSLAAEHAGDYDVVCCLGGDGTLSDVVAGLLTLPNPPPIGYFPLGTANDVATTLKLPKNDTVAAAKLVVAGTPLPWDAGSMGESDKFVYVAAFGAFTDVSYETTQQSKQTLGSLAYLLEGMNRLPRLPHYHTRVELSGDRVFEGDYIFGCATNSTSVGGLVKLDQSRVDLSDGEFEISLVRYPANLLDLNTLMSEAVTKNGNGEFFTLTQAHKARFIFDAPVPWTRDGEAGGAYADITIENISGKIEIIC